jgi:hypothetical protein
MAVTITSLPLRLTFFPTSSCKSQILCYKIRTSAIKKASLNKCWNYPTEGSISVLYMRPVKTLLHSFAVKWGNLSIVSVMQDASLHTQAFWSRKGKVRSYVFEQNWHSQNKSINPFKTTCNRAENVLPAQDKKVVANISKQIESHCVFLNLRNSYSVHFHVVLLNPSVTINCFLRNPVIAINIHISP